MPSIKEKLLINIPEKGVRKFVEDHVQDIPLDEKNHIVTLLIDKRYAINILQGHRYIEPLIVGVKKTFGSDITTTIRLTHPHHGHDREMLIPHAIHYE